MISKNLTRSPSGNTMQELYSLAFQYRKTGLWELVNRDTLFAVRLPDGRAAYCCAADVTGTRAGLTVYIGAGALTSLVTLRGALKIQQTRDNLCFPVPGDLDLRYLQCGYANREDLLPELAEEAEAFAEKLNIQPGGPDGYPHFDRREPLHRTVSIQEEAEARCLIFALRAALEVAKEVTADRPSFPLFSLNEEPGTEIPILIPSEKNSDVTVGTDTVPERVSPVLPMSLFFDNITQARLLECPATGTWDCGILFAPHISFGEDPSLIPTLPIAYERDRKGILPISAWGDIDQNAGGMLQDFLAGLLRHGCRPAAIRVYSQDLRGQVFFRFLADMLRIPFTVTDHLPELNEAMETVLSTADTLTPRMTEEFITGVCDRLAQASPEDLRHAGPALRRVAESLVTLDHPAITDEIRLKLKETMGIQG